MGQLGRPREIDRQVTRTLPDGTTRTATKGDLFIEELARGTSQKVAAALAGLSEATVLENVARGDGTHSARDQDDDYADFARRVRDAKARGQAIHERTIVLAGVPRPVTTVKEGWRDVVADGEIRRISFRETSTREEYDWRASAWALQHQYGVQAPTQVELSGPDGGPISVREEAALLLARLDGFLEGRESMRAEGDVIEVVGLPPDGVS